MKLVLFNIIGSKKNGTGHIYRALSLAKEIKANYKVIFITTNYQKLAIKNLKETNYKFFSYPKKKLYNKILSLEPSVVINDILSTKKEDIQLLKNKKIKVINFEDLGDGNQFADLTINEIFEKPKIKIKNKKKLWGKEFFFIREEFLKQKKNKFKKIKNVLLFFGGSDPNNLTLKTVKSIYNSSINYCVNIIIITGVGYKNETTLNKFIKKKDNINLIRNTKKISNYMKKCQIAFTSNGRTTYELAHMNIPSIVISHNIRESQHKFATLVNGFINLGRYQKKNFSYKKLDLKFIELINNQLNYKKLYNSMLKINFCFGRDRVKKEINKINKLFI